ncbi:MAG: 50S ribosomal protein L18 [Desulfatibacillaceae bacterium]|nr:50S ribosomal protein L18 [Desulfatibacillaceae bacterium]
MARQAKKILTHLRRKKRVRAKVSGTGERPRLAVFRSARHIYAQVVDDRLGATLVSASTLDKDAGEQGGFESKVKAAEFVGKLIARRAKEKGIVKVVFDRNGHLYHGRVKALSQGAREEGLEF